MSTRRFFGPAGAIWLILLAAACCAGGCSAGGSVNVSDWRHSVQKYIHDQGQGDPAILREVTWPASARGFTLIGGDEPSLSQDVRGLLLGFKQIGQRRWFIFIVGVVNKQVVDDIRLEAMSQSDNGDYTWRTSAANPQALQTYREYQTQLWKKRFPGRESAPAQYTIFPQQADVFNLDVEAGKVVVTHQASGARWELVIKAEG